MAGPRSRSRSLFLHATALSDAEYAVYVDALYDVLELDDTAPVGGVGGGSEGGAGNSREALLTDEELETRLVGLRDARAWMRGRYKDVRVADIDKVRLVRARQIRANSLQLIVGCALCSNYRSYTSSSRTSKATTSPAVSSLLPSGYSYTCVVGRS